MEKLNQTQIAELFAKQSGMSHAAADQFVKSFFDIIADKVISDGIVKVKGLGTFKLLQMEDRESVNVNTGERITIAGHQKISFVPDAVLKENLNRPFSAFETVLLSDEQAAALEAMESVACDKEEQPQISEDSAAAIEEPLSSSLENTASSDMPAVSEQAREVTQPRGLRIILKIAVWILSIALVLGVAYVLLWPVIGIKSLALIDKGVGKQDVEQVEMPVIRPVAEIHEPDVPVQTDEAAQPEVQPETKPAPVEQPVMETAPYVEPARQPEPQNTVVQTVADVPASAFKLNRADDSRDLSEFTAADTVNYRMAGTLREHVMQQGETLTIIAKHEYGTKKLWPYIAAYNHLDNFKSLKPGVVLKIPKLEYK